MSTTLAVRPQAWAAWAPWTDKKGRLHPFRATVFTLLLLPGLWLVVRYAAGMLGPRALNELIHGAGYWAVWILVASLVATPAKAVLGLPNVLVVRRMVGNAALAYAGVHLLLYAADQKWNLGRIASEIALRFYLTIGFVALVGLVVLGSTSTDGIIRRMGQRWKRLHRAVYAITALALFHFFLQVKADVSVPLLAAGIFFWLMLWRCLPAGRDRSLPALLGLAVASAVLTLLAEYLWYRFATNINPARAMTAELDPSFGLHPAGQVLALGVLAAAAVQVRRWGQGRAGQHWSFPMALFAALAWTGEAATLIFGLERDSPPNFVPWVLPVLAWTAALGLLGFVRWAVAAPRARQLADVLVVGCAAYQVMLAANGIATAETLAALALAAVWAMLLWQAWRAKAWVALTLVPLGAMLGCGAALLL